MLGNNSENVVKPHVLVLPSWYPESNQSSLGIFIKRHTLAVVPYCNISVIYVRSKLGLSEKYKLQEFKENKLFTVFSFYQKTFFFLKPLRFIIAGIKAYKVMLASKGKPGIIHVHIIFPAGILALFYKMTYKVPYVITENWTGYMPEDGSYTGFLKKLMTKLIVLNAEVVLPVTQHLKQCMLKHNIKGNYQVIPNVVDTKIFFPLHDSKMNKNLNFLHVSTLDKRQKNVDGILRAFKKYNSVNHSKLTIIGNHGNKDFLEAYAVQIGLIPGQNVLFWGYKKETEIAEIMRNSDVFVLFSNYENMPCVLLEAMASGLPVIATNVGGIKEFIGDNEGILVNACDENGLQKALYEISLNYMNYDKNNIAQNAEKKYGMEIIGRKLYQVYSKIGR